MKLELNLAYDEVDLLRHALQIYPFGVGMLDVKHSVELRVSDAVIVAQRKEINELMKELKNYKY